MHESALFPAALGCPHMSFFAPYPQPPIQGRLPAGSHSLLPWASLISETEGTISNPVTPDWGGVPINVGAPSLLYGVKWFSARLP